MKKRKRMRKCGKCVWGSKELCDECIAKWPTENAEVCRELGDLELTLQLWSEPHPHRKRWWVAVWDDADLSKGHLSLDDALIVRGPFGTSKRAEKEMNYLSDKIDNYKGSTEINEEFTLFDDVGPDPGIKLAMKDAQKGALS